jgi:hypothetical protein
VLKPVIVSTDAVLSISSSDSHLLNPQISLNWLFVRKTISLHL